MTDYRISFQLYSARKFPPVEGQLEALAAIGYDAVEPYRGAYGDDPAGFRKMLDTYGLACPTAHIGLADLDADIDAVVETAGVLGLETVIIPAIPAEERSQDANGWKALGEKISAHAEALKARGLKLAWHNHDFEYVTLPDGSRPIDHLLAGADVMWEPDIGWIVRAKRDVASELARFSGKVVALHIKDTAPDGVTADDGWTDVGAGTIDWRALWPAIETTGSNLLVLEHDEPSDWRSFAENSYTFLTGKQ
ncbi:sugar phosphate isomerase/epimerase family protein [Bauldia sp.]|uniref:sugar phosphate isomerase/epimerase family protein n=1 Tax=Bauldia sp. TaxID=2575872 RepID=UPI003BAB9D72